MHTRPFPKRLLILLVFIGVVNFLAIEYYWYWRLRWFDMPMHFLGGLWLAGVIIWFRFFSSRFVDAPKTFGRLALWGVLGALGVGLVWEFYEGFVGLLTVGHINAYRDTLGDLFFDMLGGFVCAVLVWLRINQK